MKASIHATTVSTRVPIPSRNPRPFLQPDDHRRNRTGHQRRRAIGVVYLDDASPRRFRLRILGDRRPKALRLFRRRRLEHGANYTFSGMPLLRTSICVRYVSNGRLICTAGTTWSSSDFLHTIRK